MSELLNKISSYNIFNYLLPGVLFAVLVRLVCDIPLQQDDIIIGLFVYYFMGLVISRVGSIVIEPILRKLKIVQFSDYSDFVKASATDNKLEVLSETNNMYRTLVALFVLLILAIGYQRIETWIPSLTNWGSGTLLVALLLLFILSYSKQTQYINQRIRANQ